MPKLIIGPAQNLHDARYAAAVGIDYLVFDTHGPFAHTLEEVIQIRDWISGPQIMIRFDSESLAEISLWLQRLQPAAVITPLEISDADVAVFHSAPAHKKGTPAPCTGTSAGNMGFTQIRVLDNANIEPQTMAEEAWWLGSFALNPEGLLDYEACDLFLQSYSLETRG